MIFFSVMKSIFFVLFSTRRVYGASYFTARNHRLLYNNQTEFLLKGVNYSGFETYCAAPHGLWAHNLDFYLDFISANEFNAIRLPFSFELTWKLDSPSQYECVTYESDECKSTIGNLLGCLFQKALDRNIFIVIDFHSIGSMLINEHPLGPLKAQEFYDAWDRILDRVIHYPNLLGLDIKNEPHGTTTWDEWGSLVNDFMNHIYNRYPDYQGLFFVEGLQDEDACWGGSFATLKNQLNLARHNIVFSPHTYGVSVLGEKAINYGEKEFHKWFGFLNDKYDNPIILGEAGGFFTGEDMHWHFRYSNYLKKINQTSSFYWSLNPDSADTKGILNDDWTSYNDAKLKFLKDLQPYPTKININHQQ